MFYLVLANPGFMALIEKVSMCVGGISGSDMDVGSQGMNEERGTNENHTAQGIGGS